MRSILYLMKCIETVLVLPRLKLTGGNVCEYIKQLHHNVFDWEDRNSVGKLKHRINEN